MLNTKIRYPGGRKKALTFSFDDGLPADRRLVKLFDRFGFRGTFNLNSGMFSPEGTVYHDPRTLTRETMWQRLTRWDAQELFCGTAHEVACHAARHGWLSSLPTEGILAEMVTDRLALEADFGPFVQGMAYPYGAYSEKVAGVLAECGIVYGRTTVSTGRFDLPERFLMWHPTCSWREETFPALTEAFDKAEDGELFYIWGHSCELDVFDGWGTLETLGEKLGNRGGEIYYATNGELYRYVTAFRALEQNLAHTALHNPTGTDVWFAHGGTEYCVPAGQTVQFDHSVG